MIQLPRIVGFATSAPVMMQFELDLRPTPISALFANEFMQKASIDLLKARVGFASS